MKLEAEQIIIAIGQTVDPSLAAPGLAYGEKGTVSIDGVTSETGARMVFAGGDIVSGATTVIQAIASARQAVRGIELSLGGDRRSVTPEPGDTDFIDSSFRDIPRAQVRELSPSARVGTIDVEDVPGLSAGEIETEAHRCFHCGCLAVGPSDMAMALVALGARVITTKRSVPAQVFFNASATRSTILNGDELIKEVRIPQPKKGTRQVYEKFTLRKPIDFAIVSVASVITIDDGVCKDARIVLGAVAPEPVRARAAEEFLKGRTIDETTARKAGELALDGAKPLSMNAYKVEIAKTLVKRALMS
jgi:CO/xanthine dehydrogenase FAD-binding subunit